MNSEDISAAESVCNMLENKYLERGTFSKYCKDIVEVSLKPVFGQDDYEFTLVLSIQADGKCNIDEDKAEELIDSAEDDFFNLLASEHTDTTFERLRDLLDNKSFILNGDVLY